MRWGEIGAAAKDAVPALIKVLRYEDGEVHRSAAFALGEIGTLEATKALEEYQ